MKKILKITTYLIIGYVATYIAIWLHEVAHAIVYKYYGCKQNIFDVYVPFYFGNANPLPVDYDKVKLLLPVQIFRISVSGLLLNFVLGCLTLSTLSIPAIYNKANHFLVFFIRVFGLTNFLEAGSYLTLNTLIPSGDMVGILRYNENYKIYCLISGFTCVLLATIILKKIKDKTRIGLIIFSLTSVLAMGGLRLLFA